MKIKWKLWNITSIGISLFCLQGPIMAEEMPSWAETVFPIEVKGQPLNTADGRPSSSAEWFWRDGLGHAAPVMHDVDGDGKRDLVVGTFTGRFRVYKNHGTETNPKFKGYEFIKAGGKIARVANYCCMAGAVRFQDIDKDNIADMTVGSYTPGTIYWFKGLGKQKFAPRQMLTDYAGVPIFTNLHRISEYKPAVSGAKAAFVDWDDNGTLDMIIGNAKGDLVMRRGLGAIGEGGGFTESRGLTDIESQPTFSRHSIESDLYGGELKITIEGQPAIPDKHIAPAIADWDGDGLWDILAGSDSGAVYLLRNSGELGEPEFNSREELLPPGKGYFQWALEGVPLERGSRSEIDVTDYNGDGKMDLILGHWISAMKPRDNLTNLEKRDFQKLIHEYHTIALELLDATGLSLAAQPGKIFKSHPELSKKAAAVKNKMKPYVQQNHFKGSPLKKTSRQHVFEHGLVWVYLQK